MINQKFVKPAINLVPEDIGLVKEMVRRRTPTSKLFSLGNGAYRSCTGLAFVHYKDNPTDESENFKEVDLTVGNDLKMNKAMYDIEMFSDRVGFKYTSKLGGTVIVELDQVGNGNALKNFTMRTEGNQVLWDNVAQGVHMKVLLGTSGAEIYKKLDNRGAARRFVWKISEDVESNAKFEHKTLGKDDDKWSMEMRNSILSDETANGKRQTLYEEVWTGRVGKIVDRKTRRKEWSTDPKYPVIIDATVNEVITTNADDGQEATLGTTWDSRATGLWTAGHFTWGRYHGGVRFQTIAVPNAATINSASFKISVNYVSGSPVTKIYVDDVDDAGAWTNGDRPSDVTKTGGNVTWTPASGSETVGITAMVQGIVNRGGWASSGDMRFAILNDVASTVAGTNIFGAIDYFYGNTALSGRLDIDYTPSSGGVKDSISSAGIVPFSR